MTHGALMSGFVATQVGEALANYALADNPLEQREELAGNVASARESNAFQFFDDEHFWRSLRDLGEGSAIPASVFHISRAAVSEWVARVPGLYWEPGSAKMRTLNPAYKEAQTSRWTTYIPQGKSRLVSGGVGTLKFSPSEDGFRLVTLTTSCNASTGVPALISDEVWEHCKLAEGVSIDGDARWGALPRKWAEQFPLVRGIRRGCLILNAPDAIRRVGGKQAPVQVHPFSIMEYWSGDTQLHDFVYVTVDTGDPELRRKTSTFFEEYRTAKGRDGSYLLAADMSDPLWSAEFASPEEMRARKAPQLRLIEKRVQEATCGVTVTEGLLKELSKLPDIGDLRRLSEDADIPSRRWSEGGRLADEAARLVDEAIRSNKMQALIQVVMTERS
ncbi:MAG TPA: hypothetical protein VNT29_08265 [Candidatus Limnocylindrales bacterium]|nr:hypothetical protein [Candidatus Limnocylindrales bacterium]